MSKTCLIVVPGIAKKGDYIDLSVPELQGVFDDYDHIEHFDTEKTFDKSLTSIFADKWDFIPYFFSKRTRKEICTRLNNLIGKLRQKYDTVDILSHSLGTIISLECGRNKSTVDVDMMVCLQSPMNNFLYGGMVKNHVKKYCYGLNARYILCTYNRRDWAVAHKKTNLDFLINKGITDMVNQIKVGKGHKWLTVLTALIKKFKELFNA